MPSGTPAFCGFCGSRLPPEVRFCVRCGRPIAEATVPPASPVLVPVPAPVAPVPPVASPAPAPAGKRSRRILAGVAVVVAAVGVVGALAAGLLSGTTGAPRVAWDDAPGFSGVLEQVTGAGEVRLGGVESHGVSLVLPAGTFPAPTRVTVQALAGRDAPAVRADQFLPLGPPVRLEAKRAQGDEGTTPVFGAPATISFRIPAARLPLVGDPDAVRVASHFAGRWHYLRPSFDRSGGVVSVRTHHFSVDAPAELTEEALVSELSNADTVIEMAKEEARAYAKEVAGEALDRAARAALAELDLPEESRRRKVLETLLDENGDLAEALQGDDPDAVKAEAALLFGKALLSVAPEGRLQSILGSTVEGKDSITTASTVAAHLADGRYTEAARALGEHFVGELPIVKAVRAAATVTRYAVDRWSSSALEAAYEAMKQRIESGRSPEEAFAAVEILHDAAFRQQVVDARKAWSEAQSEGGLVSIDPASDRFEAKVRAQLKASFLERYRRESEAAAREGELMRMVRVWQQAGLVKRQVPSTRHPSGREWAFTKTDGPLLSWRDDPFRLQVGKCLRILRTALRMSGRTKWPVGQVATTPEVLSDADVVILLRTYGSLGHAAFTDLIRREFVVSCSLAMEPDAARPGAFGVRAAVWGGREKNRAAAASIQRDHLWKPGGPGKEVVPLEPKYKGKVLLTVEDRWATRTNRGECEGTFDAGLSLAGRYLVGGRILEAHLDANLVGIETAYKSMGVGGKAFGDAKSETERSMIGRPYPEQPVDFDAMRRMGWLFEPDGEYVKVLPPDRATGGDGVFYRIRPTANGGLDGTMLLLTSLGPRQTRILVGVTARKAP